MATSKDINNLVINKIENKEVYDYMVQNNLINDDELYLIEGEAETIDLTKFESHIVDKNNPHEVTAEQVGAATVEYVDALTKVYAQPNEPTNPKEGDIWIDTDAAVVSYAEGESF